MKKTLIAGAASFALAAMPVIGVFATDPAAVVDTLTVTVNESCTFATQSGSANSYTKSMNQNDVDLEFGTSTFVANCNNATGYTISAEFETLKRGATADANDIAYNVATPTAGAGTWTAYDGSANIPASNGTLADTNTFDGAQGSTYTVTYKVATHAIQPTGTYVGHATYTLSQKASS